MCVHVFMRVHMRTHTLHCFVPLLRVFSRRLPADKQDIHNANITFALEQQECTMQILQEVQKEEETRRPLLFQHR